MKKTLYILSLLLVCVFTVNAQKLDRSIQPKAAPAKEIDFKDAQTFTLPNGLKVFVVEDNRAPVVYYSLSLDVKPALEGEKAGSRDLFSSVMGTATTNRSKEQLNKDIDLIGAHITAGASGAYARGLKKYDAKMLELMSDMIFNPKFDQEELDLQRDKLKSGLSMVADDPSSINERVSSVLVYGKGFPAGEVQTVKSVENVTLADLENYYKTYFAPNVSRLVIVGDITLKEAKANAEKYFGKWAKKDVPVAKYTIPQLPASSKVAMVTKDGAPQSAINIAYPLDYKPGAPDAAVVSLLNYTYGGGSASRLFKNLRETHSYTYGVYSSISSGELVGSFGLSSGRGAGSVKAAATDSAIYQIFYEMDQMINKPIGEKELKDAKAALAGSFGRSVSEPSVIAGYAVNIDKYNLPKDYYKNYLKRLEAVTTADIQAAAKKYLKPDNAFIVVVGDKSHAEGLKKFAGDGVVSYYDIDGNPTEAPKAKSADVTAEEVIAKYVEAIGGKDAVEKVETYKTEGQMSMMGQNVNMLVAFKKPNSVATHITMGDMVIQKIIYDGNVLKLSGMQGDKEYTEGDEVDEIKNNAGFCPERNYIKNGYELSVEGIEPVNGKDAYVLKVNKGKVSMTEYYDVESGLKVKTAATVEGPQGQIQQITEINDYRVIDGLKVAFEMKQTVMNMATSTTLTSVEINKPIDEAIFK